MINDINKIEELIKEFGSPLYIFSEDDFIDNYHHFENAMKSKYEKYKVSFSYKTNYAPYITSLVKKLGGYAEVVSDMEYYIAKKNGYEDNQIIYNGPIKGELGIKMLLNDGMYHVDNLEELRNICKLADSNKEKQLHIGLRLNINVGQSFVSRFGIDADSEDLFEAIKMVDNCDNLTIQGLHCHIGQSRSVESWRKRASVMLEIYDKYFSNYDIKYFDLGSGMFARMEESFAKQFGDNIPSFEDYADAVCSLFDEHFKDRSYDEKPVLFTEPGTTLINSYIDFVATVSSIKHIKGSEFVVLDCSKHNLGEVCTLKKVPINIAHNGNDKEKLSNAKFVGYTCLEHDVMYSEFAGELAVGDYVVFGNIGGYSNVSKPPFISPNCAMVTDKGKLIKEKESFEDILRTYK